MPSDVWGKLAAASLVFAFVVFMVRFPPWFLYVAYIASIVIIFISLYSYGTNVARALWGESVDVGSNL
jgi:hypothetical protein